jgi:hypothetical protein
MPELPDIEIYLEALESRIEGDVLESILLGSPCIAHDGSSLRLDFPIHPFYPLKRSQS